MSTITLGGTTLSGSLQWADRYNHSAVAQSTERTLSGNLVVFHSGISKGQPITLQATEDTGWFTKAMIDAVKAMAEQAGGQFTLDWHQEESHTVMFMHDQPPAVQFEPLLKKVPQVSVDYFTGTIKLFTV